ncbi:MAG: iron chelate uptake ABC transporter family permease subunit [Clostridiales bacterium]|nr:iron chelate uptake ABC transporter family permease subunit [Clostridiales bacterium]
MSFFKRHYKRVLIYALFAALFAASLMIGAVTDVNFEALFRGDGRVWSIMINSRLPRTLAVVLAASGLSVAGLIMQAVSRNKFTSPSTSGTINAASLGMLIAYIALGAMPPIIQTAFAFAFALVSTLLFTSVINRLKIREVVYIPLIGMMYGGLISAASTAIAYRFEALQILNSFGLGNFARVGNFTIIYIITVPLILSVIFSTRFAIIGMGEDFSKNLGVNYNRVVFFGLVIIALVSASSFVAVGGLPFIGLIIPNMTTSFYGDNIKKSIVDIMLFGADFVLVCDILSRLVIFPFEISASLTISVVGGIIFMIYLIGGLRHGKAKAR